MGLIEWDQIGCEKFQLRFFDPDGNLYDTMDTMLSDEFFTTNTDDDYELYTARHRWMWARDGKSIIHEATFDKLIKSSLERIFHTLSEVISINSDGMIERAITQIIRVEKIDGTISVDVKQDTKEYSRL